MKNNTIIKWCAPTKLDIMPYGCLWKHIVDENIFCYYLQTSQDQDAPKWETMSHVLERVYVDLFEDEKFINKCLKDYSSKCT